MTENVERRALSGGDLTIRDYSSKDGAKFALRGYAVRFGSTYDMGWFTEEVSRNAFKNADMDDVRILFNHDPNQILGRTKSGTAKVGVDEKGLWYEVELPKSADNIREAVERGDIDQSSWGFHLKKDSWTRGDFEKGKKEHRVIEEVALVLDASPVTFPANPDTTVAKRSFDAFSEVGELAEKAEQKEEQNNKNIEAEIAILDTLFEAEKIKNSF